MFNQLIAQTTIGEIKYKGVTKFSESALNAWSEISKGNFFNPQLIEMVNRKLINKMREQGYLYASVDSVSIKSDSIQMRTDLTWYIDESLPFKIGTIKVNSDSILVDDIYSQLEMKAIFFLRQF
ncbi:POTRA domain-containing protein [Calditrichota bacterium]